MQYNIQKPTSPRPKRPPQPTITPKSLNRSRPDYVPSSPENTIVSPNPRARTISSADKAKQASSDLYKAESAGATIPLHKDIEAVLNQVRIDWSFMQQEDFQELQLSLDLLDGPDNRSVRAFTDFMNTISPAIELLVDDYYSSFAFSVQHFSDTLDGLVELQNKVQEMKTKLIQSREHLQLKQFDLLGLWNKNLVFKEMLRIMDLIDQLRRAPDEINSLISHKLFLSAVTVFNDAWKTIHDKECSVLGALDETRKQLVGLRETIFEAIVSNINNHIYLKSSYCEGRWMNFLAKSPNSSEFSAALHSDRSKTIGRPDKPTKLFPARPGFDSGSSPVTSPIRGLHENHFIGSSPNRREPVVEAEDENEIVFATEPTSGHPETDSLAFITLCLEAITRMGMVQAALKEIIHRMPKELFGMVEKCITQALDQFDSFDHTLHAVPRFNDRSSEVSGGSIGLMLAFTDNHMLRDVGSKNTRFAALRFLFTTVFAKLDAVVEAHKLTCNMVDAMSRRPNYAKFGNVTGDPDSPVYTIEDVAMAIHDELKSVLHDYLKPQGSTTELIQTELFKTPPLRSSVSSTLPDGTLRPPSLFKFGHSASEPVHKLYSSQLPYRPKESQPGTSKSLGANKDSNDSHVMDKYSSIKAMRHTAMFGPDLEYVCCVYRPTCDFFARLVRMSGNRITNTNFLDELVLSTYIPQMEAKVQSHVHKYINGPDGFVVGENNYLQSACSLLSLIQSLCATIWQVPFRTDEYLRMIEDILVKYIERCFAKYRTCVTATSNSFHESSKSGSNCESDQDDGAAETISGAWARHPELLPVVCQNTYFKGIPLNAEMNERVNVQEILMQARLCNDRSFQRSELIFDKKKLEILAHMRSSLKWFRSQIIQLMETSVDDAIITPGSQNQSTTDLYASQNELSALGGDLIDQIQLLSTNMESTPIHHPLSRPTSKIGSSIHDMNEEGGRIEDGRMLAVPKSQKARFNEILNAFQALSDNCVVTLHIELRVHAMYFADLAMREGTYYVEDPGPADQDDNGDDIIVEPEPYIMQLNTDLSVLEELCLRILPISDSMFVFDGVGLLLTHYLVANVRYLRRLNIGGVRKMVTSIKALHQHLIHVDLCQEVRLDHARRYYELFLLGPERMLDDIADQGALYTFDEYQNILDFMCDVGTLKDRLASESEVVAHSAVKAERAYQEWSRQLEAIMQSAS